jgi:hypothetical protein
MYYPPSGKSVRCVTTFGYSSQDYLTKPIKANLPFINRSLENSIVNSNLLRIDTLSPDMEIKSHIYDCHQFAAGLSCGTEIIISYTCIIADSTLLDTTMHNRYVATFKDATVGATRCRKSIEGAIRENHKLFITQLYEHLNKK